MNPRLQAFFISSAALGFLLFLLLLLLNTAPKQSTTPRTLVVIPSQLASSAAGSEDAVLTTTASLPPSPPAALTITKKSPEEPKKQPVALTTAPQATTTEVERIQNPYATPPLTFDMVNVATRQALVNILCMPKRGTLNPISGSGVIIDPRGVILTNAHVAQYVLLSQGPDIDLTCTVRTGSPASPRWRANILYLPPVWVDQHVAEINKSQPMSTGEHDYALLSITGNADGSPISGQFPYLPVDIRNGIGFLNDAVLAAAYPAEFVGGISAQNSLYPVSSVTTIKQLLTFGPGTIDSFSVGGVIAAQGGSSGGAVTNAWDRLIGIISITSAGATTADRDLRAVTLSYIDQDFKAQTGKSLSQFLAVDPLSGALDFARDTAPALLSKYLQQLNKH